MSRRICGGVGFCTMTFLKKCVRQRTLPVQTPKWKETCPPAAEFISQKVFIKSFCKSRFLHKSVNLSSIITDICVCLLVSTAAFSEPCNPTRPHGIRSPSILASSSHRMYVSMIFEKSTPPQNRQFLFTTTKQDVELTVLRWSWPSKTHW